MSVQYLLCTVHFDTSARVDDNSTWFSVYIDNETRMPCEASIILDGWSTWCGVDNESTLMIRLPWRREYVVLMTKVYGVDDRERNTNDRGSSANNNNIWFWRWEGEAAMTKIESTMEDVAPTTIIAFVIEEVAPTTTDRIVTVTTVVMTTRVGADDLHWQWEHDRCVWLALIRVRYWCTMLVYKCICIVLTSWKGIWKRGIKN